MKPPVSLFLLRGTLRLRRARSLRTRVCSLIGLAAVLTFSSPAAGQEKNEHPSPTPERIPIRLATSPAVSPDGKQIAFGWGGDIWLAGIRGGNARQFSTHPAYENGPIYSPDGNQIAFTSNRSGQDQVWIRPLKSGLARQVTFHSEGSRVVDWYPDGKSILVEATRDFATRRATRFYRVPLGEGAPEILLFNAEGHSGALSPDGKRLLFCREGGELYRKGYRGSRASQIWMAENLESEKPTFTRLIARQSGARSPLWKPDGSGFYYLGDHGPNQRFNVWERDLASRKETRLTDFTEDPAILPGISRDGSRMIFRTEFEFHRLALDGDPPRSRRIPLTAASDSLPDSIQRRTLAKASNVCFSADGLEVAFVAGGDVWVMDTVLREPIPVTQTSAEEREPVFSADGKALYFIRDAGSEADLFRAERSDSKVYWWRNQEFEETRITRDKEAKADLQTVPGGKRISWISGRGDLWVADGDGKNRKRLLESWNRPDYDWSPDGKWIAWAVSDNNFNRDVWIASAAGEREPFNLSRHPDSDGSPRWSPNGKILAFTGRRFETETDIYYVYLSKEEEQRDKRDRTLNSAIEKMEKLRKRPAPPSPPKEQEPAEPKGKENEDNSAEEKKGDPKNAAEPKETKPSPTTPSRSLPEVVIDFDRLYERIKRISIPGATERSLFWAHDSKRLAFSSEVEGDKGTFLVTFPDKLSPTQLTSKQGSLARWIARDDTILWLVDGVPSSLSKGKHAAYSFSARQEVDREDLSRIVFRRIWRTMRDNWYDEHLNNLDWDTVGEKYEDAAATAIDPQAFDRVIAMMLGELNGSHLGFKSNASSQTYRPSQSWEEETAHLGVEFDLSFPGPGLRIASVIPGGPADEVSSQLQKGEIILEIDGAKVNRNLNLTRVLNGALARDIRLEVLNPTGKGEKAPDKEEEKAVSSPSREVVLRPISYSRARDLLKQAHLDETRRLIDRLSKGRIGYVAVPRMTWNEFVLFEEEIYARGAGKEGLIIDVRDNGGGFTADHLLTVLTPAEHAITVPRGGGPGYPQDRRVYATWNKPITVLCNQNSFSNAEIFSHAIKELGRGELVGLPTAGGVISTGSTRIMEAGTLRLPFRGWFRSSDGADLELNGAVPDHLVSEHPSDYAAGRDRQAAKAVRVLLEEIEVEKATPSPELVPASQRGR